MIGRTKLQHSWLELCKACKRWKDTYLCKKRKVHVGDDAQMALLWRRWFLCKRRWFKKSGKIWRMMTVEFMAFAVLQLNSSLACSYFSHVGFRSISSNLTYQLHVCLWRLMIYSARVDLCAGPNRTATASYSLSRSPYFCSFFTFQVYVLDNMHNIIVNQSCTAHTNRDFVSYPPNHNHHPPDK